MISEEDRLWSLSVLCCSSLVTLSGGGNLQSGFDPVIAELLEPEQQSPIQLRGGLPPAPELAELCQKWQDLYTLRNQNQTLRISVLEPTGTRYSEKEFRETCEQILQKLNEWLDSDLFRPIDRELRTELNRLINVSEVNDTVQELVSIKYGYEKSDTQDIT